MACRLEAFLQMRFHGLMLLRDEEDIIAENLKHLLTWVDALYIYDLGSTDSTFDIVQEFARHDARIIVYKREPTIYSDGLRSVLFSHYRQHFSSGDWIVKLDADEFYPIPPPVFQAERLDSYESMVYLQWYFFRLTKQEVARYEAGTSPLFQDRHQPIAHRRRFYKVSLHSEPRMFRYRESMRWSEECSWPYNAGVIARNRIPIHHYPHRDPVQMERRFQLRAAIMSLGGRTGDHWRLADWRQELVDAESGLATSAHEGRNVGLSGEQGIDTGPLLYWKEGESLPEVHLFGHLPEFPRRLLQWAAHSTLLPWLDRCRPAFDPAYRPPILSEEDNARIDSKTGRRTDAHAD